MSRTIEKIKKTTQYHLPEIEQVENALYEAISDSHGITYEICTKLVKAGGKRMRPILVLCSAQCFDVLKPEAIKTATAAELIHMASLVHDDIIDKSNIRRNIPTVNAQIGNQSSVLIGDYLFAKAFEILASNKLIESMRLLVEAISEMCHGEIIQASNRFNINQTVEDYYSKIYKKTGILISACCQVGSMAGGANEEQIKILREYGINIGYAFQIVDDILDFTGNEKTMGKPVGSDLKNGNITLPILKLMEQKEYKKWLQQVFKNKEISIEDYQEIIRVLKDSYAIEESYKEAENCIRKAKNALRKIEDSHYKGILLGLADKVIERVN